MQLNIQPHQADITKSIHPKIGAQFSKYVHWWIEIKMDSGKITPHSRHHPTSHHTGCGKSGAHTFLQWGGPRRKEMVKKKKIFFLTRGCDKETRQEEVKTPIQYSS
jgi:hypothetical protein